MTAIILTIVVAVILLIAWKVMENPIIRVLSIIGDILLIIFIFTQIKSNATFANIVALIIAVALLIWMIMMKNSKDRIEAKLDRELEKREKKRQKKMK